jgi:phage tail sheath protein FI
MATAYKTPGVYVEEISIFPPSIAQVETAVPAFIGYTKEAKNKGESLLLIPTRLKSLVEYEQLFGAAPDVNVDSVVLDADNNVKSAVLKSSFLLYDSLRLFFSNGGSKCYIISIGTYGNGVVNPAFTDFEKGLAALRTQDEPTLIVFPDATLLPTPKLYDLQKLALQQAADLGDRFVLCDLYPITEDSSFDETVAEFRDNVGIQNLPYGASYAPHLRTNLEKKVSYRNIKDSVKREGAAANLDIKSLATTDVPKTALEVLEKSIDDVNKYRDAIKTFQTGKNAASIEAGYLTVLDDFKAKLATHDTATNTPTTQLRTSYRALIDYIYDAMDALVDAPLADGFFKGVTGTAAAAIYLEDDLEKAASADGNLNTFLLELNRLTRNAHNFVGGDDTEAGSNLGNRYLHKLASFTATEWGDIFTDAKVDAEPLGYTPYPVAVPADDVGAREARKNNLASGEKFLTALFKKIAATIASLSKAAEDLEATYEKAALSLFPKAQEIIDRVKNAVTELPPSGAIAGVYTSVDAARGVHKAPANVSLGAVVGVAKLITHEEQAELNVDVVAGKSINAIRPFTGKGILVWGARTLAGNDNEWRYVSVRRFFNMVEESTKKATERFVFEPNDANTWIKVKTMIENFLVNQWRGGALAGSTPEQAFFVKVGLGQTMTPQDILEGLMIVEIGMAAVRPAEFIILRFSHKMQEA